MTPQCRTSRPIKKSGSPDAYISYDLDKPGQNYKDLIDRLTALRATRILLSVWLLETNASAEQVWQDIDRFLDSNDRIFVGEQYNHVRWRNLLADSAGVISLYKSAKSC